MGSVSLAPTLSPHGRLALIEAPDALPLDPELAQRLDRLCELNVIEQVLNVCHTSIVRDAWQRGQPLAVHGWIYGFKNGLLRDLDITVTQPDEVTTCYREALSKLS